MIMYQLRISVVALLLIFGVGCQGKRIVTVLLSGIGPNVTNLRVYAWREHQLADERYRETYPKPKTEIQFSEEESLINLELLIFGLNISLSLIHI